VAVSQSVDGNVPHLLRWNCRNKIAKYLNGSITVGDNVMEAINLNNQEIIKAERNKEIKEKIGTNEMKENDNDK
jgi:hypothetical protein